MIVNCREVAYTSFPSLMNVSAERSITGQEHMERTTTLRHIFKLLSVFALLLLPNLPRLNCHASGLVYLGLLPHVITATSQDREKHTDCTKIQERPKSLYSLGGGRVGCDKFSNNPSHYLTQNMEEGVVSPRWLISV